jgi:hypothetical protein
MLGSTRCNNLRRRLPRMSPSLLSKRLGELETAGLVFRQGRPRRQRVLLDSSREGASPARLGDRDVEGSKRRKTGTDKPKRDRRPNEGLAWPQPICSTKAKGRLVYVEAAIHGCHGIRKPALDPSCGATACGRVSMSRKCRHQIARRGHLALAAKIRCRPSRSRSLSRMNVQRSS